MPAGSIGRVAYLSPKAPSQACMRALGMRPLGNNHGDLGSRAAMPWVGSDLDVMPVAPAAAPLSEGEGHGSGARTGLRPEEGEEGRG